MIIQKTDLLVLMTALLLAICFLFSCSTVSCGFASALKNYFHPIFFQIFDHCFLQRTQKIFKKCVCPASWPLIVLSRVPPELMHMTTHMQQRLRAAEAKRPRRWVTMLSTWRDPNIFTLLPITETLHKQRVHAVQVSTDKTAAKASKTTPSYQIKHYNRWFLDRVIAYKLYTLVAQIHSSSVLIHVNFR